MDHGSVLACAAGCILHGAAAAARGAEPWGPAALVRVDLKSPWTPSPGIWDAEGVVVAVRIEGYARNGGIVAGSVCELARVCAPVFGALSRSRGPRDPW